MIPCASLKSGRPCQIAVTIFQCTMLLKTERYVCVCVFIKCFFIVLKGLSSRGFSSKLFCFFVCPSHTIIPDHYRCD